MLSRVRQLVGGWGIGVGYSRTKAAMPTVFHITHHKAGSQWINRIFHALAYDRLVLPVADKPAVPRPADPTWGRLPNPLRHPRAIRERHPPAQLSAIRRHTRPA